MYKTTLAISVPLNLAERLDEMAREQNVSRNRLVGDALSEFAFGKPLDPPEARNQGNRDGRESEALEIIRKAGRNSTIAEILEQLQAAGIRRGRNWVSLKRQALSRKTGPQGGE